PMDRGGGGLRARAGLDDTAANAIVTHFLDSVGAQARLSAPDMPDLAEHVARAQTEALEALTARLNAALPPQTPPLTAEALRHSRGSHYTYEFGVYLQVLAQTLAGDPHFHFRRGARSQYPFLAQFLQSLNLAQAYRLLPALSRRVSDIDLEVEPNSPTSTLIRWRAARQLAELPAALHARFIHVSCQAIQGVFSQLPATLGNQPAARIKEWRCQLNGDECCEWEFTWQNPQPRPGLEVWIGLVLSAGLAWLWWVHGQLWELSSLLLAGGLPTLAGWLLFQLRRNAHARAQQAQLLAEQREQVSQQYEELQQTSAGLQSANLALRDKVAELTSLNEISQAISASLNLDELLTRSLQAIIRHLPFERVLVMRVDEDRRVLTDGRALGDFPTSPAFLRDYVIPLDTDLPLAEIARTGRPLVVRQAEDIRHPSARTVMARLGTTAFVGVPLTVAGRTVGVLLADTGPAGRPVDPAALESLRAVGSQLASAVDRAQLYQTLEQRVAERTLEARASEQRFRALFERERRYAQELALLERVRGALVREFEPRAFFQTVVEAVAETFSYASVSCYLLDGAELVCQHQLGHAALPARLPLDRGVMARVVVSGRPALIPDVTCEPEFVGVAAAVASEICVPVRDDETIIGVLNVESQAGLRLDDADLRLMLALSETVSLGLRNTRLYAALQTELEERQRAEAAAQRRARELEELYATLTDITAELSLPKLLGAILARALALVDADVGELGLYDDARQSVEIVVSHNLGRDFAGTRLALGEGAMGQVALTHQPLVVTNYAAWPERSRQYEDIPPCAAVFLPLIAGQALRGVVAIGDSNVGRLFSPDDLRLVSLFARQATIAIENAQLYQQAVHAADRRATLYRASQEISGSINRDQICEAVHRAAAQVMPSHALVVALRLPDGETLEYAYLFDAGQRWPVERRPLAAPSLASYIIRTGVSLRTDDIETPEMEALTGAVSFGQPVAQPVAALAVPLRRGGTVTGMISVQSYAPSVYSAEDQELLELLAAQAATAFENARLFEEAHQRAEEAETLRQAGFLVTATLDQPTALARILTELGRVVPHDSASVQLLREGYLEVIGGHGWEPSTAVIGVRFPIPGDNPNTRVIQTRQPLVLADAAAQHISFENPPGAVAIRGWLGAPLIVRDHVIGMLTVDSRQPDFFTPRHVALVAAFASQVAAALDNARLYQQAALAADRREALYRASRAINASVDREQICLTIHRAVGAVMPLDFIAIALLTEDRQAQELLYAVEGEVREPGGLRPVGAGLLGKVIADGQSLLRVDYAETELVTDYGAALLGQPSQSLLAVPIQLGAVTLGALTVQSDLPRAYTSDDLELLELLAAHAATAFENARLFAVARQAAERRETLLRVSQEISASVDPETICAALHRAAGEVMSADVVIIGLLTADRREINVLYMVDAGERQPPLRRPADQGMLGYVIASDQTLFQPDYTPEVRAAVGGYPYGGQDQRLVRSLVTLPLKAGASTVGVLSVQSYTPRAHSTDDLELLKLLATQAAIAFENARLFEQTQHSQRAAEAANEA
ncbi:MAG: GAF domain-containing protein, partial [Anaerolineales bacterium]|nr:GAF domain-containing protein [Anaerolineales bacterium]